MQIVSDEWINVTENYCEHFDIDAEHYGEMKCLKKDAPEYAKKIYIEQLKIWKEKGFPLPEDADEYL